MPDTPPTIPAAGAGSASSPPSLDAGGGGSASAPPALDFPGSVDPGVIIGGDPDPDVTGFVPYAGLYGGKPLYSTNGSAVAPATGPHTAVFFSSGWILAHSPDGQAGSLLTWVADAGSEATPDLATGWASGHVDASGDPSFVVVGIIPDDPPGLSASAGSASAPPSLAAGGGGSASSPPTIPAE